MSLTLINNFQNKIYNSLLTDQAIKAVVKKIYIGVTHDAKPPFLLIEITGVTNLSIHKAQIYDVEFEISLYAKDTNHNLLVKLADSITENISKLSNLFNDFTIDGIKANSVVFNRAKDLVLNKLSISYQASISRGI